MQMHAKSHEEHKNVENKDRVYLQIRPIACSHLAKDKTTHVNQNKNHVTADPQPSRSVLCSQRFPEVTHNILNMCLYHVAAVLLLLAWHVLDPHTGSPDFSYTQSYQTSAPCLRPNSYSLEKTSGGEKVSPSGGWLSGRVCVGWQLPWWLEDWKVEPTGRSLVPGKCLPCCPGQGCCLI